ncbi:MAG TPA: PKD domain-containing protein [Flavobacteriales bacterium]|nr:PKD domain-containing protein [Flavobacteriales bacterium]HMW96175.1 PKD domain-containing protein [Flavobacteriales bacterium]HNI03954.1 PKD domain-containing protein [Flavobacteriales bacterium]HNK83761.1 PKD domain-containing protein [Flavobacteriales bacterium]HNM69001.1 PKD domain-containing protein [Flavobacteriales bacterium]
MASILPATTAAQCDGCIANVACTADPAYPALCPTQPPDATAGEPYSADITFWLPVNFTDPGTGFNVDFMLMTITGVTGLPYGLDITYSEPSGVYHPQENPYGCARICGIPLSAGTYSITISILAGVEYNGFPINAAEQFPITLVVQPGTSSNTSFSFTPTTGCGSAVVEFQALIDGDGSPVTYDWDFGNGNMGADANGVQTYNTPGTYSISLQTSIGGYVLNNVHVGGVNDNWCGDVEEPSLFGSCQGSPDLYFILTDGQGGTFESSHGEDSGSQSWSGLNITLGTPPYAIEFWDEDPVSVDDALGTYNIPQNGEGDYTFTVAGGTFGSLHIDLVPVQVFSDTDTVVVFAAPQPIITYDTLEAQICVSDTGLVGITWFNDGDTVLTGNTCVNADSTGTWWAVVHNAFGCATTTDTVVICPTISIEQNGDVLYTATGLSNYLWTWNGDTIAGADGPFIIAETGGLYAVSATNIDGCVMHAEFLLLLAALPHPVATGPRMLVSPNPTDGPVRVVMDRPGMLHVLDATGRVLIGGQSAQAARPVTLTLNALPNGMYLIQGMTTSGVTSERVLLAH